jgi:N-methylhydantoinase B
VPPGAIVRYETCGGGGYGDPCARDPALVERDVREGKVSTAHAASVYGVVVDPRSLTVDVQCTAARRASPRAT